jgi:hypothetical protein
MEHRSFTFFVLHFAFENKTPPIYRRSFVFYLLAAERFPAASIAVPAVYRALRIRRERKLRDRRSALGALEPEVGNVNRRWPKTATIVVVSHTFSYGSAHSFAGVRRTSDSIDLSGTGTYVPS